MVERLEMICFRTISSVGEVRSSYIEVIQKAKQGDFEDVRGYIRAGQEILPAGCEARFELIQKEAQGGQVGDSMILAHTEDQLMSVEGSKIIAEEMFISYERIAELEKRLKNR